MSTWELWLFLHLGGLLALTAGVGASLACKGMALRVQSPEAVLALLATARTAVKKCAMPGSVLLLGAGAGLVHASKGAYEYHEPWIVGAVALWCASAIVGVKLHGPRSRAANEHARSLIERGAAVDEQLRSIIRSGRPASILDTLLLVGMVALMVFKPGS